MIVCNTVCGSFCVGMGFLVCMRSGQSDKNSNDSSPVDRVFTNMESLPLFLSSLPLPIAFLVSLPPSHSNAVWLEQVR